MVDIHSHILPGVDDGVPTIELALELARMEASGGTTTMIATPHVDSSNAMENSEWVLDAVEKLNERLVHEGISYTVRPGAELFPTLDILKYLDAGKPITLNNRGKHVLLDTPRGGLPNDLETLLFELRVRGVTPIIAHPERSRQIQEDPSRVAHLIELGAVMQVNAGSLRGQYGPMANKTVLTILERHEAHFVASDSHKPRHAPSLKDAWNILEPKLSPAYLNMLMVESGKRVLDGDPLGALPARTPAPAKSKSIPWFKFWVRKNRYSS